MVSDLFYALIFNQDIEKALFGDMDQQTLQQYQQQHKDILRMREETNNLQSQIQIERVNQENLIREMRVAMDSVSYGGQNLTASSVNKFK